MVDDTSEKNKEINRAAAFTKHTKTVNDNINLTEGGTSRDKQAALDTVVSGDKKCGGPEIESLCSNYILIPTVHLINWVKLKPCTTKQKERLDSSTPDMATM